jgi:replication factor C large subunit
VKSNDEFFSFSKSGYSESMMLSEKARPKQIAQLIGNEQARLRLVKWLRDWKLGSKAALLMGPPGVGKSTSVYAVAKEFGYTVIEYNASDVRTKTKLSGALTGTIENASLYGEEERLLIFLDEVDGISGRADYAGVDFILDFIQNANVPVAMAANVEDDPKLKKLVQKSLVILFAAVHEDLILIYIKAIAKREGIQISQEALEEIANKSRGDVRFALNMLQTVVGDRVTNSQTDKQFFSDASAIAAIFDAHSLDEALQRLRQYDASPVDKIRAIFDSVVSSKTISEEQRKRSLRLISDADILLRRINKSQRWRILRYLDRYLALAVLFLNLRVADGSIPWNLRLAIWNDGRVIKEILSDLAPDFHVGRSEFAAFYLPYVSFYLKQRTEELSKFVNSHDYTDSERRVMLKLAAKH